MGADRASECTRLGDKMCPHRSLLAACPVSARRARSAVNTNLSVHECTFTPRALVVDDCGRHHWSYAVGLSAMPS
eukprot:9164928-Pyramimonas_sp.AAC.1